MKHISLTNKKMFKTLTILFLFAIVSFSISCSKDNDEPEPTTGKITVNITVQSFGSIANVDVFLINNVTDNTIDTKVTNTNGVVEFTNVAPGSYYIVGEYETNEGDLYDDESNVISVAAGDERTVNLVLELF